MSATVYTQEAMYLDVYGSEEDRSAFGNVARKGWIHWHEMASAYVWGRQDARDRHAHKVESYAFGNVYAMAQTVTDGSAGPVAAAFHQYVETGRIVVNLPGGRVGQVWAETRDGATWAECAILPWVGTHTQYWPGIAPDNG